MKGGEFMLSFKEFVATKRQVQNNKMSQFGEYPEDYDYTPKHYFIYDNTWWVQEANDGSFYTIVAITECWSDDISEIEEFLYQAYCEENNETM